MRWRLPDSYRTQQSKVYVNPYPHRYGFIDVLHETLINRSCFLHFVGMNNFVRTLQPHISLKKTFAYDTVLQKKSKMSKEFY